jgi:hypothetical protein
MMKNLLSLLFLWSLFSHIQPLAANQKGEMVLQPSFNIGGYYGRGLTQPNTGFTIGSTLNFDYSVHEYIAVGGYGGITSYLNNDTDFSYRRVGLGGRAVFHWWKLLDDKISKDLLSDRIEFYLPVHFGVHFVNARFEGPGGSNFIDNSAMFRSGAGLGFRYYFNPGFGVAAEWGYQEMSWAKIGVAFKF